jgi:phosphoribosylaminoimidazole (AIR) synthetase
MVLVVAPEAAAAVSGTLAAHGEQVYRIGRILEGGGNAEVRYPGLESAWTDLPAP